MRIQSNVIQKFTRSYAYAVRSRNSDAPVALIRVPTRKGIALSLRRFRVKTAIVCHFQQFRFHVKIFMSKLNKYRFRLIFRK